MSDDAINIVNRWFSSSGEKRKAAAEEAAHLLLKEYEKRWMHFVPIELHRLSASLHVELVSLENLKEGALLIPTKNGFRAAVSSSFTGARFRTTVAHELAHTLFYTNPAEGMPKRLFPHSEKEEAFCFDVARYLLAPRAHLEAVGIFENKNPLFTFDKLTTSLRLSKPIAARIMLSDYEFHKGIAGRWVRSADGWKQIYGSSSATPVLTEREKKKFRALIGRYLNSPEIASSDKRFMAFAEQSGEGTFVVFTV